MGLKYLVTFHRYEGLNYNKKGHGEWSVNRREFNTEKEAKDFIRRISWTAITRNIYLRINYEP